MKERISQLMDGELDEGAAGETLDALRRGADGAETWRTYHLIGDTLRDTRQLSAGFEARLAQRLAGEPTVLAPARRKSEPRRWLPVAAAAGAAVAFVGWVAFAPQAPIVPPIAPVATTLQPAPAKAPAAMPISSAANDYLLAHQVVSPRISWQGMAPYVRAATDEAPRQ